MAKRIISDEQRKLNEVKNLYVAQKNKTFEYKLEDFIIADGNNEGECKWKHKDWNVWMKGGNGYDPIGKTQKMIATYILECTKPYGKRNLSQFHLNED